MGFQDQLDVLIVDDHDIVRKGLVMLISRQGAMRVVGGSGNRGPGGGKIPGVVPKLGGVGRSSTRRVGRGGLPRHQSGESRCQEIVEAIRVVGSGRSLLNPGVTAAVLERLRRGKEDDPWSDLTSQEQRIVELLAEGKTNKEVSLEVNLSDKTVKNYVSNILGKLEVSRRSQAAAFVAERKARTGFRE